MRKMKKILAMLLALMMVLQMAPVVSAEGAAEKVAAIYVSDPSSISASAVGYYWDATNIYYADGAEVKSYSLAAQGINLTDYNQIHAANIDGKAVNVQFTPDKGEAIANYAADNNAQMYIGGFTGFYADGSSLVYDSSVDATDGYASSRSFDVVSHDKDLYLEQTMKFDALPVKAAADHGVFVAMSVEAQGFYFVLSNRIDGTEYIMHATIQNEGDGSLAMYIYYSTETDIRWGSAYGNSGIKLGVNVGEEFVLGTQWNADNSVDIYVNNSYVGGVSNGTRRASGQIGGGNFYNCYYGNLEGDAKFTISNAAIYNGIPKSIAADTAAATLEEIVAAANLSVVTGNVALPAAINYAHGAMPITWATSDASVITADGKVTVAKEDKTATLTASAVGQTVEVNVTVPGSNSYVADYAADISAVTKTGYYWDAQNLYYYNGQLSTYALADLGIALTDYNQSVKATIGGKTMFFLFAPSKGAPIATFAADDNTMYVPGWIGFAADGANIVYDSSVATGVECSADSRSNVAVNHANDLYLEQTFKFDALPVKGVPTNGVFIGNSVLGTGFTFYMGIRPNATGAGYSDTFVASIQNEGDGALAIYIANQNTNSGHGSSTIPLGVNVGEEFVLGTQWNADGSADIYVNDSYITSVTNATRELGWAVGTGNFYGVRYNNLPGDTKFTISDVAVYNGIVTSVAEDTAVATLDELVAALDLSAVKGNIDLPAQVTYAHGAMPITWISSNPDVLAANGTLVAMPKADTTVTLTATCGGQTASVVATVLADLDEVVAVYTANIAAETATGYYWDAQNLYYVNGAVATYALADLGITLTDYNQSVKATIGGKTMTFLFAPSKGAPIATFAADDNTMYVPGWIGFAADGANIVYDSSVATGVECSADSRSNVAVNHANDLYLEQTFKFDALPVKGVPTNGVFIGNSVLGTGFTFYMGIRPNATGAGYSDTFVASIQNEGDGALAIYIANQNTNSGHGSSTIPLGVNVGEEFVLGTQWNADGSADIYVNDSYITSVTNATRELGWAVGTGNFYGVRYNNLPGDTKFTISNVAVYNGVVNTVAEDTAEVSFNDLIAGLDLSAVNADVTLPTQVTYAHGAFPITWTSSNPELLSADGKLGYVPAEDTAVVLTASYLGQETVVTANVKASAATSYAVAGAASAVELYEGSNDLHTGLLENMDVNGNTITFDNETVVDEATTVTNDNPNKANVASKTRTENLDHRKYDLLMEQTLCFEVLPAKPVDDHGVFIGAKPQAMGYTFYMNNRYDSHDNAMLATIQNENGKLYLYVANSKQASGYGSLGIDLGVKIGDTFTLSTLWKKDGSVDIYIDGKLVTSVTDATRPLGGGTTGQDGYAIAFNNLEGDAKFTVSDVAVYSLGNFAKVGETEYADINAAFEAAAGATVTLIDNLWIGDVTIPADVTVDLNGKSVKADNLISFGDLVDLNAAEVATFAVSGTVQLDKNNSQMPVYHNVNKCYYLGDAQVKSVGTKASEDKVTFGFGPKFEDSYLYHVMSKPAVEGSDADCGLDVQITLDWTGNEGDALVFEMSEELIRKYGELAFAYDNIGLVAAMMLNVSGVDSLEIGSNVIVDVTVTSDTGVVMTGETMYYEIAG